MKVISETRHAHTKLDIYVLFHYYQHNDQSPLTYIIENFIGCVMTRVLASSVVDHGFDTWSGRIKDNKTDIRCFSPLRSNRSSTINIKLSVLV